MATIKVRYRAYLLCIWLVNDAGKWVWRYLRRLVLW
jgi:hypothetical protein